MGLPDAGVLRGSGSFYLVSIYGVGTNAMAVQLLEEPLTRNLKESEPLKSSFGV